MLNYQTKVQTRVGYFFLPMSSKIGSIGDDDNDDDDDDDVVILFER